MVQIDLVENFERPSEFGICFREPGTGKRRMLIVRTKEEAERKVKRILLEGIEPSLPDLEKIKAMNRALKDNELIVFELIPYDVEVTSAPELELKPIDTEQEENLKRNEDERREEAEEEVEKGKEAEKEKDKGNDDWEPSLGF